ncbi:hypothetical protein [Archangium primigenium]|uniref:hypothetical protein n=1 Tax=[Archangium] primigenium TaxID=2792470 RepID=UPI00195C3C76|nr:hypothetical protein [Archangium primigenium]MBM7112243.1 hypothetical protein [Archangium primigenium]
MNFWTASCVLLLAGSAWAKPAPVLGMKLDCFDAWKSRSLREPGGGPGGAQWNTEAVVCAVRLDPPPESPVRTVRLRLQVGARGSLTPVGELYVPAEPRQVLALGEAKPEVEALAQVAEGRPVFFVPASVFHRVLREAACLSKPVCSLRFVVTAQGLDAEGRAVASAREELRADFAFGE